MTLYVIGAQSGTGSNEECHRLWNYALGDWKGSCHVPPINFQCSWPIWRVQRSVSDARTSVCQMG
jgi:hypothetical protein